jgi:hypothetical protein
LALVVVVAFAVVFINVVVFVVVVVFAAVFIIAAAFAAVFIIAAAFAMSAVVNPDVSRLLRETAWLCGETFASVQRFAVRGISYLSFIITG